MDHIHNNIQGWFTFSALYKLMVERFDNATFVEVGTWKGKSAAFMAVEIANSNKNIKFYCVDPWNGACEDNNPKAYDCVEVRTNTLYEHFLNNIKPVENYIIPVRDYSVNAVKQFADHSLDFVFIDASHDYENVKLDLNIWYPKIKKDGVLAGHDYIQFGVKKAVDEFALQNNLKVINEVAQYSWVINMK
jgi:predicted O-methyltransferase YrrM